MPEAADILPIDDRFTIAAALDRILYDVEDSFSSEDALLVRSLIPSTRSPLLRLGFRAEGRGPSVGGEAAGIGQVDLRDENKTVEGNVGVAKVWRCGQYKLSNSGQDLEIWQVMSDEFAEEPKGARLEFDTAGQPQRLSYFRPRDLELRIPFTRLAIGFRLGNWNEWKKAG